MAGRTPTSCDVVFRVRTGSGTIRGEVFTDIVCTVARKPRSHKNWQSVCYNGKRYRLGGGIRTDFFICLNNPVRK